jgi:thioredoxin reductase (NADPH)
MAWWAPERAGVRPIFFVLARAGGVLDALTADLRRRYGADYRVEGASTPAEAVSALASVEGAEVALLIADERIDGAVEFLVRAHELHRSAKRILLIERGDWSAGHPVIAAIAAGQVDYYLYNPWRPLERILYAPLGGMLAAWENARQPTAPAFRIVDTEHSPRSHELRDALSRAGVPYRVVAVESAEGQALLDDIDEDGSRLPIAVYFKGAVLVQPSYADIVAVLGLRTHPEIDTCDVAIVGAGPAGLAAAVYAASEGLRTVVLEPAVPGGQAGTSSLIRNYLGFPHGVSGEDLTNRALEQAWLFGAHLVVARAATRLTAAGSARVVRTSGGDEITARAVVLANGVTWRRLGAPSLEALVGAGVFYGASAGEAPVTAGRPVFVVGGGNSAGQAALHLARYARTVTVVVRGSDLRASMSEYLVAEIGKTANIAVRTGTEVVDGGGRVRLERLRLRYRASGATEEVDAAALFLMIGAVPHTDWLRGSVALDERGFVRTGDDASAEWLLDRPPMLLETSLPGVFAAGDVRHGSVKRVASAVGEGAVAIQLVHAYLA